jgi:hypothetical protein
MHRIKFAGLALMAVVAMSAVATASASAHEFISKPAVQNISAGQSKEHVFTVEGKTVKCTTAKFTGKTTAEKATEQRVKFEYSGCTAFGFVGATVKANGCEYNLHANGETDVVGCEAGKGIEVIAGSCVVTTVKQNGIKGTEYATVEGPKNKRNSIRAEIKDKSIKVNSNGAGVCPSKKTEAAVGEYSGQSISEGESGTLEFV